MFRKKADNHYVFILNIQEFQQNKFIASFCDNLTLRVYDVYDTRESDKTNKSASIQRVTKTRPGPMTKTETRFQELQKFNLDTFIPKRILDKSDDASFETH